MILDTLDHLAQLAPLSAAFADAVAWLGRPELADLPPGRYEVATGGVGATVVNVPARHADQGHLEAHRRYADIQVLLGGQETIGWRPLADCGQPLAEHDPQTDLRFFADAPQIWLTLRPGQFAAFLPGDAHLPLVGEGSLHKIIVKVPLAAG
jgi:YhcH/YjgK/YiaL family protein